MGLIILAVISIILFLLLCLMIRSLAVKTKVIKDLEIINKYHSTAFEYYIAAFQKMTETIKLLEDRNNSIT